MSERFTYIGAVYLFLIKDNEILLQKRFQTGFMDGFFGVPSGHLDGNETAREGCAREMSEEIGISIRPEDLDVVHIMHRKGDDNEKFDIFMTTDLYVGEISNMEPHKCDDLRWFKLDELPDNMIGYVKLALDNYRNDIGYSEFGF